MVRDVLPSDLKTPVHVSSAVKVDTGQSEHALSNHMTLLTII